MSPADIDGVAQADLDEAAALVAEQLRRWRPDVVVTYDPTGGYGHPDHIQAHRVTMAALTALPDDERPGRVYWALTPRAWAQEDRRWVCDHVDVADQPGLTLPEADAPYPPSVVDDDAVTHAIVDAEAAGLRTRVLREHRTQVTVLGADYALSNNIAARRSDREGYVLVDRGTGAPVTGDAVAPGRHTGLLPNESRKVP